MPEVPRQQLPSIREPGPPGIRVQPVDLQSQAIRERAGALQQATSSLAGITDLIVKRENERQYSDAVARATEGYENLYRELESDQNALPLTEYGQTFEERAGTLQQQVFESIKAPGARRAFTAWWNMKKVEQSDRVLDLASGRADSRAEAAALRELQMHIDNQSVDGIQTWAIQQRRRNLIDPSRIDLLESQGITVAQVNRGVREATSAAGFEDAPEYAGDTENLGFLTAAQRSEVVDRLRQARNIQRSEAERKARIRGDEMQLTMLEDWMAGNAEQGIARLHQFRREAQAGRIDVDERIQFWFDRWTALVEGKGAGPDRSDPNALYHLQEMISILPQDDFVELVRSYGLRRQITPQDWEKYENLKRDKYTETEPYIQARRDASAWFTGIVKEIEEIPSAPAGLVDLFREGQIRVTAQLDRELARGDLADASGKVTAEAFARRAGQLRNQWLEELERDPQFRAFITGRGGDFRELREILDVGIRRRQGEVTIGGLADDGIQLDSVAADERPVPIGSGFNQGLFIRGPGGQLVETAQAPIQLQNFHAGILPTSVTAKPGAGQATLTQLDTSISGTYRTYRDNPVLMTDRHLYDLTGGLGKSYGVTRPTLRYEYRVDDAGNLTYLKPADPPTDTTARKIEHNPRGIGREVWHVDPANRTAIRQQITGFIARRPEASPRYDLVTDLDGTQWAVRGGVAINLETREERRIE